MIELFKRFFAPEDTELYPPCGMFTTSHIIILLVCFIAIGISFYFTKGISKESLKKLVRIFAVITTVLELIKITYKFVNGYTWVDAWVPLSYCSMFIYSLWLSGFGKGTLKRCADCYIEGGAFVGGICFLVIPATSLVIHPLFHYLSLHSMIFHSMMVYMAFQFAWHHVIDISVKNYPYYFFYVLTFMVVSYIINKICDSNLMLIMVPYHIPIQFINDLYAASPAGYTAFCVIGYSLIFTFFFIPKKLYYYIKNKIVNKKRENVLNSTENNE